MDAVRELSELVNSFLYKWVKWGAVKRVFLADNGISSDGRWSLCLVEIKI